MTTKVMILAGGVGLAALTSAAPTAAQRFSWDTPQMAVDQCTDAVQKRLDLRSAYGHLNGANVVSVTTVTRHGKSVVVRGLASTRDLGPYGVGAYGALGAASRADLTFKCSVDRYGRVHEIDIDHR